MQYTVLHLPFGLLVQGFLTFLTTWTRPKMFLSAWGLGVYVYLWPTHDVNSKMFSLSYITFTYIKLFCFSKHFIINWKWFALWYEMSWKCCHFQENKYKNTVQCINDEYMTSFRSYWVFSPHYWTTQEPVLVHGPLVWNPCFSVLRCVLISVADDSTPMNNLDHGGLVI